MTENIRWGILGMGKIAHKFARALLNSPGMTFQATGSSSLQRAREFAAQYGAPHAHGSYEELASDPSVDAIYIATPHPAHLANMLQCLDHGKAVLCEKPFTINAREARMAVEKAREKGLFLMEAMWSRFLPATQAMKRMIHAGEIGEVRILDLSSGFQTTPSRTRLFDPAMGGGALLDIGVYAVSFASMILGEVPQDMTGYVHFTQTGVDEESLTVLKYSDDRFASISCSIRTLLPREAVVVGSKGYLKAAQFSKAQGLILNRNDEETSLSFPYEGEGFEHQIAEVGRCLREGRRESELMPLDETIAIMDTMDRIRAMWNLKYPME